MVLRAVRTAHAQAQGNSSVGTPQGRAAAHAAIVRVLTTRLSPAQRQALALLSQQRDFTADDYDTLLALDDDQNNPSAILARAAPSELHPLPLYTFQGQGPGDASEAESSRSPLPHQQCSVCLETFHAGDRIRVLPCMHQFHMACVDRWLTEVCARLQSDQPECQQHCQLLAFAGTSVRGCHRCAACTCTSARYSPQLFTHPPPSRTSDKSPVPCM